MLLIDSLYINYGGGLQLLRYLISNLQQRGVEFYLLQDARAEGFDEVANKAVIPATMKARRAWYRAHGREFSTVLCFGNVPPPIKLNVPVYTYFHNINMLTLSNCRDTKQLVKFWLKREYIKYYRKNTDEWFVQTSNTANELVRHLNVSPDKVKLYPFYNIPKFPPATKEQTDYIFVGEYSGSKGHDELLEAWKILHANGIDLTLHLTVGLGDAFLRELQESIKRGVCIINHGYIPMDELAKLYMQCKATIYPSYNESFGLGLIEAMEAGCDVIASDRAFVHAICEPSEVFEPALPQSIADAVVQYEGGQCRRTIQKVDNMIGEMIEKIN